MVPPSWDSPRTGRPRLRRLPLKPAAVTPAGLPEKTALIPSFFICEHRRDGRQHFNFPAQLRAAKPMQCTGTLTRGLLILAASILLLSHPEWPERFGLRRSQELARELATPFAEEYLVALAGRDWIISSSTVREFASEWLAECGRSGPLAGRRGRSRRPRGSSRFRRSTRGGDHGSL